MIKIKHGVDVRGLHLKMWELIYLIEPIFKSKHCYVVITSALDGHHSMNSLHYVGLAVDIRKRDLPFPDEVFGLILDIMPRAYDAVNETTHFHFEYQPKNRSEL